MKTIITRNEMFSVQSPQSHQYPSKKTTLHSNFRKRELERITKENYQILRRLQSKKSNYSAARWEQDRVEHEYQMRKISDFPLQKEHLALNKNKPEKNKSKPKLKNSSQSEYALPKIKEESKTRAEVQSYDMGFVNVVDKNNDLFNQDNSSLKPLFNYDKKTNKKEKLIPIHVTNADIEITDDRKVIYRKIHKYSKKEYLIEVSKTKTKYFVVSIELNKKQFSQAIELQK